MPFRSKAQQGYLFAKHPDVAKRFAADTPSDLYKNLPEHVANTRKHRRKRRRGRGRA